MNMENTAPDIPPSGQSNGNNGKSNRVLSLFKSLIGREDTDSMRDALENLLEEQDNSSEPLGADERALIKNILGLGDCTVKDVMIPRADICQVDAKWSVEKCAYYVAQHPHSRYPVFDNDLDNVIGMVHIKDMLLSAISKKRISVKTLIRPVIFVVPSMRALDLMLRMQIKRQHVAIVIDEFGGVDGLVTIEDIVEEIVGDIVDEHDVLEDFITHNADGTIGFDTRVELDALGSDIGLILSPEEQAEEFETLGGLLVSELGRVPDLGEVIIHEASGLKFVVEKTDPRRLHRVRLINPKSLQSEQHT